MNTTIILTSTVNVNLNKRCLFQTDKNDRLQVYLKSILQWLDKTTFHIILVDNSGYHYQELDNEKKRYQHRFEVITFDEKELEESKYLKDNISKGSSEIFSIHYAFHHSILIKPNQNHFIIKITSRYFIPELENYLLEYDLNNYDCLTQYNRNRCEMVGTHYKYFLDIFNICSSNHNKYEHIEHTYKVRTSQYKNILICKKFQIEKTQRGGKSEFFEDI